MNPGRMVAWLNLAWYFARHVTTNMPVRLLGRSHAAQRFRDSVLPEGYVPLDAAERDALPRFMNCIHCGLCAIACHDASTPGAWDDTWTFVGGPSRSLDHAALVAARIPSCADRDDGARVCPTGVPIPLMAATLRRLAASPAPD